MTTKCLSCGIKYEWPESCTCPPPYDPFGYKISKWQWEGIERWWEDLALKFICAKQERKKGRQDDNT